MAAVVVSTREEIISKPRSERSETDGGVNSLRARIYSEVEKKKKRKNTRKRWTLLALLVRGQAKRRGRPRRVEGSNALLRTHSGTLFPRGSLRPKFIARGNAPPCFYTLRDPSLLSSSYFYHHRVYSLSLRPSSSSSSTSRLFFISLRSDRGDNHDEYQTPRLLRAASSISPSSKYTPQPGHHLLFSPPPLIDRSWHSSGGSSFLLEWH